MDLNKIPRWALVLIATLGLGACGVLVTSARADIDKMKSVAYQAKSASDINAIAVSELKVAVNEVRAAQETFRKEYREDQKDLSNSLAGIARAVKA